MVTELTEDIGLLYKKYEAMLYKFVHQYKADIGDMCIAFMEAIKKYDNTRGMAFASFLFQTLKQKIWQIRRGNNAIKRQSNNMIADIEIDEVRTTPKEYTGVMDSLKILDKDERMLLKLHIFYGFSQSDIATRYNCSQVHISRKLKKIYNKLRGYLEQ